MYLMRGIPGGGKSTFVKKIVKDNNLDYTKCVFSTDDSSIPTCYTLKYTSYENLSLNSLIELCNDIRTFIVEDLKEEFNKLYSEGNYLECLNYIKSNVHLVEPKEYKLKFDLPNLYKRHKENREEFFKAIDNKVNIVIVDNTNVTIKDGVPYVQYALKNDYEVIIQEPTSPHWLANEYILNYKQKDEMQKFADLLFAKNTHSVPMDVIINMMEKWAYKPKLKDYINS